MYSKTIKNRQFSVHFLLRGFWELLDELCSQSVMSQIARQDILERDAPCQITESDYGGRQLDILVHVLEPKQKNCIMGIKRKFSQPTEYYAKKRPCNQKDTEEFQMKMTIVIDFRWYFNSRYTLTYFQINMGEKVAIFGHF